MNFFQEIMKRVGLIIICINIYLILGAQDRIISRPEYIEKYKSVAINEMQRTGIPASIKLAQALLESDNGNSRLAVKANNHFGIKCHNEWTKEVIYHDDDKKRECFRKYNSPEESFRDHSDFLLGSTRYGFLFELNPTDYKGWAKGLKKAGYATNPDYDKMLIKIIEDNKLHQYDEGKVDKKRKEPYSTGDVISTRRPVYKNNRVNYIIVKEGDSYESIRKEMQLLAFELSRYNESDREDSLFKGQILYIQPKRNKAEAGIHYHIVKEGETMYEISQKYAIKLSVLYRKNLMEFDEQPVPGQKLSLRKQLKSDKSYKSEVDREKDQKEQREKETERENIEFEFEIE